MPFLSRFLLLGWDFFSDFSTEIDHREKNKLVPTYSKLSNLEGLGFEGPQAFTEASASWDDDASRKLFVDAHAFSTMVKGGTRVTL